VLHIPRKLVREARGVVAIILGIMLEAAVVSKFVNGAGDVTVSTHTMYLSAELNLVRYPCCNTDARSWRKLITRERLECSHSPNCSKYWDRQYPAGLRRRWNLLW
jgi:hypothetical protein